MNSSRILLLPAFLLSVSAAHGQSIRPTPAFPLTQTGLVISRPVQPPQPFTVAGEHGVIVGTQDGSFESWILPVKLLSHLTIEANLEGYTVPIPVNPQAANIEVRPDHTTITYSHAGFTLRQIMFSPNSKTSCDQASKVGQGFSPGTEPAKAGGVLTPEVCSAPHTGPIVLFQIDAIHPLDLVFRFTPEMRWMWPKRNEGIPSPEWVPIQPQHTSEAEPPQPNGEGFYILHLDYGDLAGAVTIPTATPGVLAPYQERPQVHPLELHLHYDPKRDGTGTNARYFPLLMAVATTPQTATSAALRQSLDQLNTSIPEAYKAHAAQYAKLESESTSIVTPDKALNEAFQWGVVSIEQLKAQEYITGEKALVAGYYASADSARPGFGWFFGRDALYTLYAVNSYGDFALTRSELEFLIARQRADGKIMHEFSQTASDPSVDWKSFPYMYAAADATPLFLMAMRDYLRASGDTAFLQAHKEAIEKAWAFETAATSDTDHDGIYDNSQGTGWVESWPNNTMPHQEVYLALLDKQASEAYAALEKALGNTTEFIFGLTRASSIQDKIEQEYYDPQKGCYAFSHNMAGDPNGATDHATTVYPAIAWWDYNQTAAESSPEGAGAFRPLNKSGEKKGALAPENISATTKGTGYTNADSMKGTGFSPYIKNTNANGALAPAGSQPLAHPEACLQQFAAPTLDTDWGLRDVATTEPFYDGLSYHQGSVWPLFTGWAALAEYRANQPLAGEQMLMQNVDLTWAQDPGSVTELLSGDFFVPFGRSTSHQLWSSAMVITPTLRGLFGISLDAATNTITVNPHLPANWNEAEVRNIVVGNNRVDLHFLRDHTRGRLKIFSEEASNGEGLNQPVIKLRSDVPGSESLKISELHDSASAAELTIPLPDVQVSLGALNLPTPGSRTTQPKLISQLYGPRKLTLTFEGQANTYTNVVLIRNQKANINAELSGPSASLGNKNFTFPGDFLKFADHDVVSHNPRVLTDPLPLRIHFPQGQGYQTLEFTLTW